MRILWFAGVQLLAVMGKDFNCIVEGMGHLRLSTKELVGKTDICWKESERNSQCPYDTPGNCRRTLSQTFPICYSKWGCLPDIFSRMEQQLNGQPGFTG